MWYNLAMLFGLNRVFRGIICQRRILAILAVAAIGTLALFSPAHAMGFVATVLSDIAMVIIELVGKIFIVLIEILLAIVQYNDFINAPAVVKAWVLVRDVANMAFLIIFIAIAFATIMGVEKYEYKQLLPKLLIMAVVINFSRTICGIIIDAAQVVMMTFVNGFKDVAAGNLIRGFGVADMVSLRDFNEGEAGVSDNSIAAASILAVAMLIIAAVTVGIMVIMFLIRVIFLWILIVLSPLAFMLSAAPGMSGKFNDWWGKFTRYVVVGPLLAFFLWLAFSIMSSVDPGQNLATQNNINFDCKHNLVSGEEECDSTASRTSGAITAISRSDNLLSFFIAIALLLLALSTANSIGVAGGNLAGTAMAKIQSGGIKLAKLGALFAAGGGLGLAAYGAYRGGKGTYKGARRLAKTEVGKMVLEDIDRKVGGKIVSKAARAAGHIPFLPASTRKRLMAFQDIKTAPRLGKFKETWMKRRQEEREEGTLVKEAQNRDAYNLHVHGIRTDYAGQAMAGLVEKRTKEQADFSMDEDSIVSRTDQAEKDLDNAKANVKDPAKGPTAAEAQAIRKASIEVLALEKLVTRNNAQNAALAKQFAQGNVTPALIADMGNIDANPENLADYLETFHGETGLSEQVEAARKIENEGERKKRLDDLAAEWIAKFKATAEGTDKSDVDMKMIIGNRLYAKKYRVYDQAKASEWQGKDLQMGDDGQMYVVGKDGSRTNENEFLAADVMHSGRGVDIDKETGEIADRGAYQGTADILHWQQWQKQLHQGLDKTMGLEQYGLKFERDLGVDAMKANNLSFAFTVKEMTVDATDASGKKIRKQVLQRIDTANAGDLKLHDNLFGGKLGTGSVSEAAKQHPMTMNQQSFTSQGMFTSTKAPSWGDQMIQATAAGDPRAWSNERIDASLGLVNLRREDLHYPLSEEDKKNYAKLYFKRHNPKNGIVSRMPPAPFIVRGSKLLQALSIDEISNPGDVEDYFRDKFGLEWRPPEKKEDKKTGGRAEGEKNTGPRIIVPNEPVQGKRRSDAEQAEYQRQIRESRGPGGGNPPAPGGGAA